MISADHTDEDGRNNLDLNLMQGAQSSGASVEIPGDVLVHIFLSLPTNFNPTYMGSFGSAQNTWDWACVTEVCSYWHAIATETPKLWSYLNFPRVLRSTKQIERYLLLSKDSDLIVDYCNSNALKNFTVVKMLLEEMRRIRQLRMVASFNAEEYSKSLHLLNQPAPRAESINLKVHMYNDYITPDPRFLFPITSPGILRRVKLCSFDLSSTMARICGLTHLSIESCYNLSISELLNALEASPELSSLSITSCSTRHSLVLKSVYLPYLVSVQLELSRFSEIHNILINLEIPNLLWWKVICRENLNLDHVAQLDVFTKLLAQEREWDLNGTHLLTSEFSHTDIFWIKLIFYKEPPIRDAKEQTIEIRFEPADLNLAFRHIVVLFGNFLARMEYLTLRDINCSLNMESCHGLFCASASVKIINMEIGFGFEDRQDGGLNCLKALGIHSAEEPYVPCPELDHILILQYGKRSSSGQFLSVMEGVLRTRSLHGSPVRKLSIQSDYTPRDDKELNAISRCVRELEWINVWGGKTIRVWN